jgi:hypothetical protein
VFVEADVEAVGESVLPQAVRIRQVAAQLANHVQLLNTREIMRTKVAAPAGIYNMPLDRRNLDERA